MILCLARPIKFLETLDLTSFDILYWRKSKSKNAFGLIPSSNVKSVIAESRKVQVPFESCFSVFRTTRPSVHEPGLISEYRESLWNAFPPQTVSPVLRWAYTQKGLWLESSNHFTRKEKSIHPQSSHREASWCQKQRFLGWDRKRKIVIWRVLRI